MGRFKVVYNEQFIPSMLGSGAEVMASKEGKNVTIRCYLITFGRVAYTSLEPINAPPDTHLR